MSEDDFGFIPTNLSSQAESLTKREECTEMVVKSDANFEKEIVLHSDILLSPKIQSNFVFLFSNLTCSKCELRIINMHIKCRFKITDGAKLVAENCTFESYALDDAAIELLSSTAVFKGCRFVNSAKCVHVGDNSTVRCENCSFENARQMAMHVINGSECTLQRCTFTGCENNAVYLFKCWEATVSECTFLNIKGRAVFSLDHGLVTVSRCRFENCQGGSIGCHTMSCAKVNDCYFKGNKGNVCHAARNSQIVCYRCFWYECGGVGLTYEYSTGLVDSCVFSKMEAPAVCCFGRSTNPVISNSATTDVNWSSVVVRDFSTPFFCNCSFSGSGPGCCAVSDFSQPSFAKCSFQCGANSAVLSDNGSKPLFCACDFRNCQKCIKAFNLSEVSMNANMFSNNAGLFDVASDSSIVSGPDINLSWSNEKAHVVKITPDGQVACGGLCEDWSGFMDRIASECVEATPLQSDWIPANEPRNTMSSFPGIDIPPAPMSTCAMVSPMAPSTFTFHLDSESSDSMDMPPPPRPMNDLRRCVRLVPEPRDSDSEEKPRLLCNQGSFLPRIPPRGMTPNQQAMARRATIGPNDEDHAIPVRIQTQQLPLRRCTCHVEQGRLSPLGSSGRGSGMSSSVAGSLRRSKTRGEISEILTIEPPREGLQAVLGFIPEMRTLQAHLVSFDHMNPPKKKQPLNMENVLKQFQDKQFSFTHVKCEHCDHEADSVCCPCGHHAWCSECAKMEEAKGGAVCPRCHCRCMKTTRIFDNDLCSICLTNAADTILLPCGHKCACYQCAECAWEAKKTCPVCNLPMWSFRHEFPV